MPQPVLNKRKCKICKAPAKFQTACLKAFCSAECGSVLALQMLAKRKQEEAKAKSREYRARKAKLNDTVPNWTKKAQAAFNAYIRERDRDLVCISCGATDDSPKFKWGWDCGHYRSVGSCPELRFEPLNAAKQCTKCNQHLSGNAVEMRKGLLARHGQARVEWIEGPHEKKHYRVDDLKEICAKFKKLKNELPGND